MQKTVSIIIPIYNSQKYLRDCIDSVMQQSLQNIEVLLVDDASTDESWTVMQEYEQKFPDIIRLIRSSENRGPGGARNLAIQEAQGKYLGFVDSDDVIDTNMYLKLYTEAIQHDYDVVDGGYYRESTEVAMIHTTDDMTGELDGTKRRALIASGGYIWSKIYHRRLFEDGNLRFRQGVILEDADFLGYVFATAHTMGNVKEVLYCYRNPAGSASNMKELHAYYNNIMAAIQGIYDKLHGLANYEEIRLAVEYEMIQMYSYGVNICLKNKLDGVHADYEKMLTDIQHKRQEVICGTYEQNPYVKDKIAQQDIDIMKVNDQDPKELLQTIKIG